MYRRTLATLALTALVFSAAHPTAAQAWMNGPDSGNGFGTHDWVLVEAAQMAGNPAWLDVDNALQYTDDPDTSIWDREFHAFDRWGTSFGDAPWTIRYYYDVAAVARTKNDAATASNAVALLSHYYSDICQPMHTDKTLQEDLVHSPYEAAVQAHTNSPAENRAWLASDGYQPIASVTTRAEAAAAYSHGSYGGLVSNFARYGENPLVMSVTRRQLNRAVNDLADVIATLSSIVPSGTAGVQQSGFEAQTTAEEDGSSIGSTCAWVSNPTPARNSRVAVSASVLDRRGAPIRGATVTFMWRHKNTTVFATSRTGADGVARSTRSIGNSARGYFVGVDITATDGDGIATTSTGFMPR